MENQKDYSKSFNAEQVKAILSDGENVMVSASAGSGKTRTMIERIVRLISQKKATVKEILAVSFTESAASDMKRKLKEKLIERVKAGDKELGKEIDEVQVADICTLHALSGKLCRTYFYEVGIAPDYKILDGNQASALKNECLVKVIREMYEAKDQEFMLLSKRFSHKRNNTRLEQIVLSIYNGTAGEVDENYYREITERTYSKIGLEKMLLALQEFMALELKDIKEEIFENTLIAKDLGLDFMVEYFYSLKEDVFILEKTPLLQLGAYAKYKKDLPRNKIPAEYKYVKDSAGAIRDKIKKLTLEYVAPLSSFDEELEKLAPLKKTATSILNLVDKFKSEYKKAKAEDGVLDFDDMQRYAYEILSSNEIASEVRSKYKYVFVDEYQDINGIQEELLLKLSNNNLFMVGDPKQSIYGFRGCRPEIFEQKFAKMQKEGKTAIRFNSNYRCSKKVIDLTNDVFSYCMTPNFYGASYKDESMLLEGLSYDGKNLGRASFYMPLLDSEEEEKKLEEPRVYNVLTEALKVNQKDVNKTAKIVASVIRDELNKQYFNKETNTFERVCFGDICVLTRNKDNDFVEELVSGLIKKGIPVNSLVEQNACDYPEVDLLINLLKLIDCGGQSIPLAIVMKSPIGNFTEEDLAQITLTFNKTGERGDFYTAYRYCLENAEQDLRQRLIEFENYILELRFLADFIGAKGVLDKVIREKCYLEHLLADAFGVKKVDRVKAFIKNSVLDKVVLSPSEMLDKINKTPQAFNLSERTEENAVKVQTIHSSKGLEYPVVIVCGLERKLSNQEGKEKILIDREWGLGVSYFNDQSKEYEVKTLPRRLILKKKKIEQIKEETRILYVATTRAQYALHLISTARKDKRKAVFSGAQEFIDYVPKSIKINEPIVEQEIFNQTKRTKKVIIAGDTETQVEELKQRFNFEYEFKEDTFVPLKKSVSEIAQNYSNAKEDKLEALKKAILSSNDFVKANADGDLEIINIEEDELLSCNNASDKERGIVAHKILQHYDFKSNKDLLEQTKDMISRGVLSNSQLESVDLQRLEKALNSSVFNGARQNKTYKEQPFLVNALAKNVLDTKSSQNVLIQGVIDLLVVGKDGAEVIDYKYSKKSPLELKKRYYKQLDLYATAVEKILDLKVNVKAIVNVYDGQVVLLD